MKITFSVNDGKASVAVEDVDLTLGGVRNGGAEFLHGFMQLGQEWLMHAMTPSKDEDKSASADGKDK